MNLYCKNIKINYIAILILVLIDILKINTFKGKRFDRNILYLLKNDSYDYNKIPEFYLNQKLHDDDLMTLQLIDEVEVLESKKVDKPFFNKKSYLDNKIYLNQFSINNQKKLLNIANKLIPRFEKLINKKLYLSKEKHKCSIIKTKGLNINSNCHYDQEHESCYTALFLFKKEGNIPDFIIIDKNIKKKVIKFELGDGVFYNGSNTYHCLDKSIDPECVMYFMSFKYTTNNNYNYNSITYDFQISPSKLLKKSIPNILVYWIVIILSFTIFKNYNALIKLKIFIYLVIINLIILNIYSRVFKKSFDNIILLKFGLVLLFLIINPYIATIYLLYILNTQTFILKD